MDVMESATTWEPTAIAKDAMFHGVYTIATGITADKWLRESKKRNKPALILLQHSYLEAV